MKLQRYGIACLGAGLLFGSEGATSRLTTSAEVLSEIMAAPDRGIPQELLEKSQCIVIVPGIKKGAFIIGSNYGKGFLLCLGRVPVQAGPRRERCKWKGQASAFRSAARRPMS